MPVPTAARGYRCNNPGNIRRVASIRWLGQSKDQSGDHEFVVFDKPEFGIRAICKVLITYQDKRQAKDGSKIDTVQEFIDRWAPPTENDTTAYQEHVAGLLHVGLTQAIDVYRYETMRGMVDGIIHHELGGQPYGDAIINEGIKLAGVKPADAPAPDRSVFATVTGLAGTAVTAASVIDLGTQLVDVGSFLQPFAGTLPYIGIIATVAALAGGLIGIWAKHRSLKTATA